MHDYSSALLDLIVMFVTSNSFTSCSSRNNYHESIFSVIIFSVQEFIRAITSCHTKLYYPGWMELTGFKGINKALSLLQDTRPNL